MSEQVLFKDELEWYHRMYPTLANPELNPALPTKEYLLGCRCGAHAIVYVNESISIDDMVRKGTVVCKNCDQHFIHVATHSGQPFAASWGII